MNALNRWALCGLMEVEKAAVLFAVGACFVLLLPLCVVALIVRVTASMPFLAVNALRCRIMHTPAAWRSELRKLWLQSAREQLAAPQVLKMVIRPAQAVGLN